MLWKRRYAFHVSAGVLTSMPSSARKYSGWLSEKVPAGTFSALKNACQSKCGVMALAPATSTGL